jgi:ABC-2 type transport system ATP-binding protein
MIKVQNLIKHFGPKIAVNGVSFSVEKGEVLGFLGPNGAGKSTTMRMITGFIPPTDGHVTVGGFNVVDSPLPAKALIGYLPENAPSYGDMTVHSFLTFTAELRGLSGDSKKRAVHKAIERCFLEPVIYQSIDTLSKGYRHRTCFAQSIIHDPEVLILDEPTDGLDPNQKHEVRTLIRNMGEKKAIIFSTHILEEVEAVCSRAIIIDRGQVVANGTPKELKARAHNAGTVTVRFSKNYANSPALLVGDVTSKFSTISGVENITVLTESDQPLALRITPAKQTGTETSLSAAIYDLAAREKWRIEELHTEEGRLDEVFRNITLPDSQVAGQNEKEPITV